jgi:hypothetical protein
MLSNDKIKTFPLNIPLERRRDSSNRPVTILDLSENPTPKESMTSASDIAVFA